MTKAFLHRIGFALLVAPGGAIAAVACLADVIRGGDLWGDWGTGQTMMLVAGIGLSLIGWRNPSQGGGR